MNHPTQSPIDLPAAADAVALLSLAWARIVDRDAAAGDFFPLLVLIVEGYHNAGREEDAVEVALAFEVCPIHHCDINICDEDSEDGCRQFRTFGGAA